MSCGISPRCAMSRMRVMGTAQVNSSEKDGNEGNIRRAIKSSASPDASALPDREPTVNTPMQRDDQDFPSWLKDGSPKKI